jgi:hypothetical protein
MADEFYKQAYTNRYEVVRLFYVGWLHFQYMDTISPNYATKQSMKSSSISLLCFTLLLVLSNCSNDKLIPDRNAVDHYVQFKITGDWGQADGQRIWKITRDSIYYYDKKIGMPYRLDSLRFSVKADSSASYKYIGWVSVDQDTLLFTTIDSVIKLQRIQ